MELVEWRYAQAALLGDSPSDSITKRGGNIHRKFSFIFPEDLQGNYIGSYHGDDLLGFSDISKSWLKKQSNFGVGGPSTENPMLIGLNAAKHNRIYIGFGKK